MLPKENLAANFCGFLANKGINDKAMEWRIIGQEGDGSMLTSWVFEDHLSFERILCIGHFKAAEKSFNILHKLQRYENVIQATVNSAGTLLVYIVKKSFNNTIPTTYYTSTNLLYQAFIVEIKPDKYTSAFPIMESPTKKQVLAQFLWGKYVEQEETYQDKFLLLIHEDSIMEFHTTIKVQKNEKSNFVNLSTTDLWHLDINMMKSKPLTKSFTWAQWDPNNQTLYYIHFKRSMKSINSFEKEEKDDSSQSPTLSAFQFSHKLPTETVLNIPLNLPQLPMNFFSDDNSYEDDVVPLRIHDSSLNLIIVPDESGMLFVCHYYLYQPIQSKTVDDMSLSICSNSIDVHFAYSVTILHHGCVVHCVMPGISWEKAKLMKPTFTMHGRHHLLVFQPGIFLHLLDVGLTHEPCCHIVCPAQNPFTKLVPCFKWGNLAYETTTLDLVSLNISKSQLIDAFRDVTSIDNRLSIIHYFLVHSTDINVLSELLSIILDRSLCLNTVVLLREALVAGSYASAIKALPVDALTFSRFLPLTTAVTSKPIQAKVGDINVGISHECLWNTNMMILSPQQRLSPFHVDIWSKLWEKLSENSQKENIRFNANLVFNKLMLSLTCYQPEALSRCTTPLSPNTISLRGDLPTISGRNYSDTLPFAEFESSIATKQEHVISVNLRELSVHLIKHSQKKNTGFRWLRENFLERSQIPANINLIVSQYVNAQLEYSRELCSLISRAARIDCRTEITKGFQLIDQMSSEQQYCLFLILERYCLAVSKIAFPLPHGFASFFTYLGYKALTFEMFIQYIENHVFELQVDVIRTIINDIYDNKEGVEKKLLLLASLPKSRSQRLLKFWKHADCLMIRGRDHAANILVGNPIQQKSSCGVISPSRVYSNAGVSAENLLPLDWLLELLKAKANINDLDFDLLIEATVSSMSNL